VMDQLTGSGTSPGAHMFEAHEALRNYLKTVNRC